MIQHFVLNLSEKLKRNIILKLKLYNARRANTYTWHWINQ